MVHQVQRVLKVLKEFQELTVPMEQPVLKAIQVQWVLKVLKVLKAIQVQWVLKVLKDLKAKLVHKVLKENQALEALVVGQLHQGVLHILEWFFMILLEPIQFGNMFKALDFQHFK
jgi:hypothetical protein